MEEATGQSEAPPASEGTGSSQGLMLAEIREQPDAITRCVEGNYETVKRVAEEIRSRGIRFAIIAARGTSDHAAIYLKYLLETSVGMPVALAAPSVFTLYDTTLNFKDTLVMGISQSGQGTDVVEVVQTARDQGAYTLGVTNFGDSQLANAAEETLLLHAGLERSVAATKTYTTSLAALALLTATLAEDDSLDRELHMVPDHIGAVLDLNDHIRQLSERYTYLEEILAVARGMNQATAMETGLKLAETCYLVTHAYSGADLEHGPIAVVNRNVPCILFNTEGRAQEQILALAAKLKERGAERLMIAHDEASLKACRHNIRIPFRVPERVSPLVYIVAAQMLAYHLSLHRGFDPDKPRGLKKVTQTV